jgi:hypothetical protein
MFYAKICHPYTYADLVTVSNILGAWKGQMVPAKAKLVRGWKKDRDLGVFTCNISLLAYVLYLSTSGKRKCNFYLRYVSTGLIVRIQTQLRDEQPLLFL